MGSEEEAAAAALEVVGAFFFLLTGVVLLFMELSAEVAEDSDEPRVAGEGRYTM